MDMVVVVETPADAQPWSGPDFSRASRSLREALGPLPVRLDLWVRTIDRVAEAGDVPGGVEYSATHEGYTLFEAPPTRPPIIRTPPEAVRCELVSAWMHHAILALEAGSEQHGRPESEIARLVAERLITALLVHHRRAPEPFDDLLEHAGRVPGEARRLALVLGQLASHDESISRPARRCIREVLKYLETDPFQARVLQRAKQRLDALEPG